MKGQFAWTAVLATGLLVSPLAARHQDARTATLIPLQASTRADGTGTVLTMAAFGGFRGMLTLDLDASGGAGKWTLIVEYDLEFNPDGTVALHPPASEADEADHPVVTRHINEGALVGTVSGATFTIDPGTGRQILRSAQLTITSGSRTFAGVRGMGGIDASQQPDGTWVTGFSLNLVRAR